MSEIKFGVKKDFFSDDSNLLLISIIGFPFILYKDGFLDLSFISIFLTLYLLLAYFSFSKIYKINISSNKTEIVNVFGTKKIIPNNKIFYEEKHHQKDVKNIPGIIKTYKLEIKFPKQKFIVYKDETPNYDELLAYCKVKYTHSDKKNINYKFYIIPLLIICSGIYFLIFTINSFEKKKQDNLKSIQELGYIKLEGILQNYRNVGKSTNILIHLKEYPEFGFLPINSIQNSSEFNAKLNLKGEKISIYISPNEYNKKITKSVSQKFYDKYFSYNEITVYKLE